MKNYRKPIVRILAILLFFTGWWVPSVQAKSVHEKTSLVKASPLSGEIWRIEFTKAAQRQAAIRPTTTLVTTPPTTPRTTVTPPPTAAPTTSTTVSTLPPPPPSTPPTTKATTTTTRPEIVAPSSGLSDAQLARLRQCEATGNYAAIGGGGRYRGAYQFSQSTWNSVAGRYYPQLVGVDPAAASPAEQDAMARALYNEQGRRPWPHCGARL